MHNTYSLLLDVSQIGDLFLRYSLHGLHSVKMEKKIKITLPIFVIKFLIPSDFFYEHICSPGLIFKLHSEGSKLDLCFRLCFLLQYFPTS